MRMLKRFYKLLYGYRCTYIILYLTKLAYTSLKMLLPLVLAVLVDEVLYHHSVDALIPIVSVYTCLFLAFVILSACDVVIWQYLSNYLVVDIKNKLWDKILRLEMKTYSKYEYGDLITILNDDARAFVRLINQNILPFVMAGTTALFSLLMIFRFGFAFGAFVVVIVPSMVYLNKKVAEKIQELSKSKRRKSSELTTLLVDTFTNYRDIKLLCAEHFFYDRISDSIHQSNFISQEIELKSQRANEGMSALNILSKMFIWILVAFACINGSLSIGGYIAMSQYITYAYEAFKTLFNFNFQIAQRKVNLNKIFTLLDYDDESMDVGLACLPATGNIRFSKVSFAYGENEVLQEVSFDIKRGKITGLVGSNGSGKSTIISLLVRLYPPQEGTIFIDDQPIEDLSLMSLRDSICIVSQKDIDSRENLFDYIREYNKPLTDNEIASHLRQYDFCSFLFTKMHIHDVVMDDLSGGQKQCIRMAAALINSAPILILDEPTSMLDRKLEQSIFSYISRAACNRTVLVVAHGENYRQYFDEVINLNEIKHRHSIK